MSDLSRFNRDVRSETSVFNRDVSAKRHASTVTFERGPSLLSTPTDMDPRPRCEHCDAPVVEDGGRVRVPHLSWCPRAPRPAIEMLR
jgi:hypothetical protein